MRDHRGVREFLPPRATRGGGFRGRGGETHRAHDDAMKRAFKMEKSARHFPKEKRREKGDDETMRQKRLRRMLLSFSFLVVVLVFDA